VGQGVGGWGVPCGSWAGGESDGGDGAEGRWKRGVGGGVGRG